MARKQRRLAMKQKIEKAAQIVLDVTKENYGVLIIWVITMAIMLKLAFV
jgi:hypothetical protein